MKNLTSKSIVNQLTQMTVTMRLVGFILIVVLVGTKVILGWRPENWAFTETIVAASILCFVIIPTIFVIYGTTRKAKLSYVIIIRQNRDALNRFKKGSDQRIAKAKADAKRDHDIQMTEMSAELKALQSS